MEELASSVATAVDVAGVAVIVGGMAIAAVRYAGGLAARLVGSYIRFRQDLGRAILLGLEFLVGADIIRTVAIEPTLRNVVVLGLVVLIRTFLSFALHLEIEGRWPWQGRPTVNPESQ